MARRMSSGFCSFGLCYELGGVCYVSRFGVVLLVMGRFWCEDGFDAVFMWRERERVRSEGG